MNLTELLKHCVSLDVESTGLNPDYHSILSAGASNFKNDETLYRENYLRAGAYIDPAALAVNGETEENLLSRSSLTHISEYQLLLELIEYCNKHKTFIIIGKNPKFDYGFLLSIWKRAGRSEREFPFSHRVINWGDVAIPLLLLWGISIPEKGFSSDDICKNLNIEPEAKPHNALNGSLHNKKCVTAILYEFVEEVCRN